MPAVEDDADVERDDIAVPKHLLTRDAVDNLVVDGDADAGGEAVETLEGRHAAMQPPGQMGATCYAVR